MVETLVIGAGPAGLLAAWVAQRGGAHVKVLGAGIGSTHIMPGWLAVLDTPGSLRAGLNHWISGHPQHPYALTGMDALEGGIEALREVCAPAGITYVGDVQTNFRMPTALGALVPAALVPESFAAGDGRQATPMLIAGPAGWRDFYPGLCAGNLSKHGIRAESTTFELPEISDSKFDATSVGVARILEMPGVRARVAAELRGKLNGAARVGLPAVIGLEHHSEAWHEMQDRLGVPVFEIPTLPPSVPGMRLWLAFKAAFARNGVQLLLDMPASRGVTDGGRTSAVSVTGAARSTHFRADKVILATGGLYGGGIISDHRGTLLEVVYNLPLLSAGGLGDWFERDLLASDHAVHYAGVRSNAKLQPLDAEGKIVVDNVRVAGRLLAGYNPVVEGSAEGVWLATAHRAARS